MMRIKHAITIILLLVSLAMSACAAPQTMPPAPTPQVSPTPLATTLPAATPTVLPGRVHQAELAGSWYPAEAGQLASTVDAMLAAVTPVDGDPLALIVPHAGYIYSGQVAAYGFKQLAGKPYELAIIIAADHQSPLSNPVSVWAEGGFKTPLGLVPVDVELAQALLADNAHFTFDADAFAGEHVVEIELPFLQRVCPQCSIVPVLMGTDDEAIVKALSDALLKVLPGRRAVIVASSDLSHYPTQDDAVQVDSATLSAIETGEPAALRQTLAALMQMGIPNLLTCACSEGPILVAMRAANGLGADTTMILNYANSADAPGGDPQQVVGYGAVMFWRYAPPDLTEARRQELLELARKTIAEHLKTGRTLEYTTTDPVLTRLAGAFVTLKKDGELRGCIGHMRGDAPLYQAVQHMAIAAATSDQRFPPLQADEPVSIEISVLSPMRRLTDLQQIEVGVHGLMIYKSGRQGVFLPQVPVEQGWDRGQYLEELCGKAGLPSGCWQEGATLYSFTATVFGD
jgi:AmmeMemoRadiSam system protein B/AmmeMemoRadiSam system protein A